MDIQINITESAQEYLAGLLAKQTTEGMSVRMFVTQPGTRKKRESCFSEQLQSEILCFSCSRFFVDDFSSGRVSWTRCFDPFLKFRILEWMLIPNQGCKNRDCARPRVFFAD